MSFGKLEFSLPEEQEEFDTACKAGALKGEVEGFREWLRGQRKYRADPSLNEHTLEVVWTTFHEFLGEFLA